jgi:3-hydroxyacyl-CoA dehydrogenase
MCQADIIGLPNVLETIRAYANADPAFWKLSALLENLVAKTKTFGSLNG